MTEVFDKHELLEELDGDREFLEESLEMMNSDAPSLLNQIREAIAGGDADAVRVGAHTLKSMVGNFCAVPAFEAALNVETLARDGDLSGCVAGLVSLETQIKQLQIALREFLDELE